MAKRNLIYLVYIRRLLNQDKKELKQVYRVVDILMERYISKLLTLAYKIRRWLRSAKREEVNIRLIGRLENVDS